MPKKIAPLQAGQKFGRLTVVGIDHIDFYYPKKGCKHKLEYYSCICDCGNEKVVLKSNLIRGLTKSCGCLSRQLSKERLFKHGKRKTRLYNTWNHLRDRCINKNSKQYKDYGERGISVCDEWKNSFIEFEKWAVSKGYNDTLTIERIDVNGNYCPENCKWIPLKQQGWNKRNSRLITYKGETKSLAEWSFLLKFNYWKVHQRLNRLGWSVDRAFTE